MNPFDYLNSINTTKKNVITDDITEKAYNSFMVNRSLSYFNDTVVLANEMNRYHHIDNKLQFDFLINMVRKRKRFSKWIKPQIESDVEVVKKYYATHSGVATPRKSGCPSKMKIHAGSATHTHIHD